MSESVAGKGRRGKLSPAQRKVLERLAEGQVVRLTAWGYHAFDAAGVCRQSSSPVAHMATMRSLANKGWITIKVGRHADSFWAISDAGRAALVEDDAA